MSVVCVCVCVCLFVCVCVCVGGGGGWCLRAWEGMTEKVPIKDDLLTPSRRIKIYSLLTTVTLGLFLADSCYRYYRDEAICQVAPGWHLFPSYRTGLMLPSVISSIIFSVIPCMICVRYYISIARVLLSRGKKMGRNLNLVLAFTSSCVIWAITFILKIWHDIYMFTVYTTRSFSELYKHPLALNILASQIFSLIGCFTSFFSPYILLVLLKNYRKPAKKLAKKICCRAGIQETD